MNRLISRVFFLRGLDSIPIWTTCCDKEIMDLLVCSAYLKRESHVFMLKILNLTKLLTELEPLLRVRFEKAHLNWRGNIRLESPNQASALMLNDTISVYEDSVEIPSLKVEASSEALTRIVSGTLSLWEAYVRGLINVKPIFNEENFKVLDTIFPENPFFHPVSDWW